MLIPEKFLILQRSSEKTVLFVCLFFNFNSVCIVSNEETKMPKRRRREKDHRKFSFLCRKDFFSTVPLVELEDQESFHLHDGKWQVERGALCFTPACGRPSQYTEGRERESPKYDVSASLSAVVLGCYSEFQFNFQMSDHRFSDKFGEKATWGSVLGTVLT